LLALIPEGVDPSSDEFNKTRLGVLNSLGIRAEELVKILGTRGGSHNLAALLALIPEGVDPSSDEFNKTRLGVLNSLGIRAEELVKILGTDGGSHNLKALLDSLDVYQDLLSEEKASFFQLVLRPGASFRIGLAVKLVQEKPGLNKSDLFDYLIPKTNKAVAHFESLSSEQLNAITVGSAKKRAAPTKAKKPEALKPASRKSKAAESQPKEPAKKTKRAEPPKDSLGSEMDISGGSSAGGGSSGGGSSGPGSSGARAEVAHAEDFDGIGGYRRLKVPAEGNCAFYSFILEFLRSAETPELFTHRMIQLFGDLGKTDQSLEAVLEFVQLRLDQRLTLSKSSERVLQNLIANLRQRVVAYYDAHAGDADFRSAGWDSAMMIQKLKAECQRMNSWVSREIFAVLARMTNARVTLMSQAIQSETPGESVQQACVSYHPAGAVEVKIIHCNVRTPLAQTLKDQRFLNHYDVLVLESTLMDSRLAMGRITFESLKAAVRVEGEAEDDEVV
jgi:hypothetical protein